MKKIIIFLSFIFSTTLWAHNFSITNITLNQFGTNANIHATINGGETDKTIKSISATDVTKAEIHTMKMIDGMMSMKQTSNFIIKKETSTVFKKGGLHFMLMGVKKNLQSTIVTITFMDNSTYIFTAKK